MEGRQLDDDGNVLLRFDGGAKGILHASQISAGEENALNIRIYGEKGGLEWHQMEPNTLLVKHLDRPTEIYRTGNDYVAETAAAHTRTPFGHPEGYLEAFANIYRNFAAHIAADLAGEEPSALGHGLSHDPRRRPRHGLHRGGGAQFGEQRGVDPTGGSE